MQEITYKINPNISTDEFIDILERSTLGQRRPFEDKECMGKMLDSADIVVVAYDKEKIVGVARSVSDFAYCCYLSDLAVDEAYQKKGIGKELIEKTRELLGDKSRLILCAAPKAVEYYPKIGFTKIESAWIIEAGEKLRDR